MKIKTERKYILLWSAFLALWGCSSALPPQISVRENILARVGSVNGDPQPEPARLPDTINFENPVSSDAAVGIALTNSPRLKAELAVLGIAEADVIDAGVFRNPRFDLLFPVGPKPFEFLLNLPAEALWQRSRRIAASQAAYKQLADGLVQNGLDLVRDTRIAHADLIQAQERNQLAKESSDLRDKISVITEARLKSGDITELEAIAARAEAGTARVLLKQTEYDVMLSSERLRVLLGMSLERKSISAKPSEILWRDPPELTELIEKALASRPDLRSSELAVESALEKGEWERSRALSLISLLLSSKEVGTHGVLTGPGLSVEVPLFNRNQGLIARADAEVELASQQYLNLKNKVAFEVAEARTQLVQAGSLLELNRKEVLVPVSDGFQRAQEQYGKGDVSYLFVLEQSRALVDAKMKIIDLEATVRKTRAQLERNVGTR